MSRAVRSESLRMRPGTGIEGLFTLLRRILERPSIQEIRISRTLEVTTSFLGEEGEPLLPEPAPTSDDVYAAVRQAPMLDLNVYQNFLDGLLVAFEEIRRDRLVLIGFVLSPDSEIWEWAGHRQTEDLLGHVVYLDDAIPRTTMLLVAGITKEVALSQAERTYKVSMPEQVEVTP